MIRTNKVDERNSSKCSYEFSYTFASRLKEVREYRKLKQEEVAEKLEINPRTYQHYESLSESNMRVPNLEIVNELSKILDCDITYLTGENEEKEFRKDTKHASIVTGLDYDTVEILEKSKDITEPSKIFEHYFGKRIVFLLNFMLKSKRCRQLLDYLFCYWFKDYSHTVENDGSGSNTITFEDKSLIDDRNISFYVSDISENIFYSWIMQSITRIKDKEQTQKEDISSCEYTPPKEKIQDEIQKIDDEIKEKEKKTYKEQFPFTPNYALQLVHHDATGEWKEFPCLAQNITSRIKLDIYTDNQIDELTRHKEEAQNKLERLYPKSKPKKKQ